MFLFIKKFLIKNFSTLYFFYQYIGRRIYTVFSFSILFVFMDSIGLALFIPLLQIADKQTSADDKLMVLTDNLFSFFHLDLNIQNMLFFILLVFALKGLFSYFSS